MKITKRQLRRIIREEKARLIKEWTAHESTPEEEVVIDRINDLIAAIESLGSTNPDMTDKYVELFRALHYAGLDVKQVAAMA